MHNADNYQLSEKLETLSINDLNLSPKAHAALRDAGVKVVKDIIAVEQGKGLLRIRNLGKSQYLDIQAAFDGLGISLNGSIKHPVGRPLDVIVTKDIELCPSVLTQTKPDELQPKPKVELPPPPMHDFSAQVQREQAGDAGAPLKTVAFVDYEHWFNALKNLHHRRPNISTWFSDLKERGRLLEVTFFGDFSDSGGMKNEINNIRMYSNRIIETKNPSEHSKKDFTDFIMLDNIYQKVIASPEVEQVVLFTGDGHFSSVAAYLRNFCSKVVGVYGIDRAISNQLDAISDWCVRIPFVNEPYMECREAILKNLKYAEDHTKSPTFNQTVRLVAEHYNLQDDAVEAELKRMIAEGMIYSVSERSRWDYKVILNILKVNWDLARSVKM